MYYNNGRTHWISTNNTYIEYSFEASLGYRSNWIFWLIGWNCVDLPLFNIFKFSQLLYLFTLYTIKNNFSFSGHYSLHNQIFIFKIFSKINWHCIHYHFIQIQKQLLGDWLRHYSNWHYHTLWKQFSILSN